MVERSLLTPNLSRRDFVKALGTITTALGLPLTIADKAAEAASNVDNRPPVIWLHFQECTGCSEAVLKATHPSPAELILELINLCYQETLMADFGHSAEMLLEESMKKYAGKYILIVEGSIPLKDNGVYCKIGGKTAIDILKHVASSAAAVINLGICATSGGIAAAGSNPTGAVGAPELLPEGIPYLSLPGCPPNPYNLLGVIMFLLNFNKLPEVDSKKRPLFAYGTLIHEYCERRAHFDAGRFAKEFGDEGHRNGFCLYQLGCKGPVSHANCSSIKFNEGIVWPIGNGNPCIGCTEGDVLFKQSLFTPAMVIQPRLNSNVPLAEQEGLGDRATATQGVLVGAIIGAAVGAGAVYASKLSKEPEDENK